MTKGVGFSSNDRLLVQGTPAGTWMSGIPKLPRINPGTALNNPRLRSILSPERRAELAGLDEDDLWGLEEKYDVFIDEAFPESRFVLTSPLVALVILDWRRGSTVPAHFTRVDLNARRDLLAAVMKAPGPFYEPGPGETPVIGSSAVLDPAPYLRNLRGVDVWEVTGGVDFDAATRACMKLLGGETDGP
jgi:HprK-related kinase B